MNALDKQTKILVTGASGTVGYELINQLLSHSTLQKPSYMIRAAVHTNDGAKKLNKFTEVEKIEFDYNSPVTVAKALKDVDNLFVLTIPNPDSVDNFSKVIKMAKECGVSYIVKLSVQETSGSEPKTILGNFHKQEEKVIEESGVPYTFLCPTGFMQNFVTFYGNTIRTQNAFYAPAGDGKVSFVNTRDIAAVADTLLVSDSILRTQFEGQSLNLTGPEALSYGQAAEILSTVTNRKISFIDIPENVARTNMEKIGMKKWLIDALMELYEMTKLGETSVVSNEVERITKRKPITFEQFVKDNVKAF